MTKVHGEAIILTISRVTVTRWSRTAIDRFDQTTTSKGTGQ